MASHESVMVAEVMQALELKSGDVYVDGTLGLAGHALVAAEIVAPGGTIVGLDWDESMLALGKERLGHAPGVKTYFFHADYRSLVDCVQKVQQQDPSAKPNGILLDLGLNNAQIEDPERGISFRADGPLDMRMDRSKGEPASAWLSRATVAEIERVLREYGDENWAKRIAQVIVDRRKQAPIKTTFELVDCIEAAVPKAMRDKRLHVATRSFQAIRIYINAEIDDLQLAIEDAATVLAPGGTLVTLSYHSGEDRAAKQAMRNRAATGEFHELYKKPLVPTAQEIERNPKSRSAKLRALRKTT